MFQGKARRFSNRAYSGLFLGIVSGMYAIIYTRFAIFAELLNLFVKRGDAGGGATFIEFL